MTGRGSVVRSHPLPAQRYGVFLYAFDLIELDGDDLRRHPLIERKTTLVSVLAQAARALERECRRTMRRLLIRLVPDAISASV